MQLERLSREDRFFKLLELSILIVVTLDLPSRKVDTIILVVWVVALFLQVAI